MASESADFWVEPHTYNDDDTVFEGVVVAPRRGGAAQPCIVLAHDWSGLTEPTRALARRYAGLGAVCFALDVYGEGVRGDPLGDNTHLMAPLMVDRARLRRCLLAGYTAARALPQVDPSRMAAVGYCFGGLCALELARAAAPGLRAVVSFHGGLDAASDRPTGPIDASILLLHGWEDPIVPPDQVLAIARELTDAGADWQLHAYGHARHAFTFADANAPDRGILYNETADTRSWAAMRTHLATTLKSAADPA